MSFPSIFNQFFIDLGTILEPFCDHFGFQNRFVNQIPILWAFATIFLLFSMDLLSSWISKNHKKPKENLCFSIIFINAFFPLDDELQSKKSRKNQWKSYIFYKKIRWKLIKIAIEVDHRFLTHFGTYFGQFWEPLGTHLGVLGEHLGGLERSLESLLPSLGASWSHLGPSWLYFELFCPSRAHLRALQASFLNLWGLILDAKWTENPSSVRARRNARSD